MVMSPVRGHSGRVEGPGGLVASTAEQPEGGLAVFPGLQHGPVGSVHQVLERGALAALAGRPAAMDLHRGADELARVAGAPRCSRMRSVMVAHSDSSRCTVSTRNCVPPMRANTSFLRNVTDRARATAWSAASPAWWPRRSLSCCTLPTSTNSACTGAPSRSANCNSWVPVAISPRRFWNPVSSSPRDSCSRRALELLELPLNGHAPAHIAQNAARLRGPAVVAELQRRHLDLDEPAVAPPEAGHPDGRSGPLPLRHGDTPAGVLLVDQAVPSQRTDRLVAHVEHGAGGRVRRHDPTLLGPVEDALGAVREQHLVGGQADRLCSPNHHADRSFKRCSTPTRSAPLGGREYRSPTLNCGFSTGNVRL